MPARKQIQPAEKVPLKLMGTERTLVLEEVTFIDDGYKDIIRSTPNAKPLMMTLDDLDDFGGYIAAEANHCGDEKKQKKLDTIFEKIQRLLETHSDEEPPQSIRIEEAQKAMAISKQSKAKPKADTRTLFQFKIALLGIKPQIWRRILVQNCTLDELHEHVQTAMGWTNSHLHQFDIKGARYGDPELLDDGFDDFECIDSTSTMLSDIVSKTGKRFAFKYVYDLGDGWEHEVVFEGSPSVDPKVKYPVCLEGGRACPPEDCGGVWGYGDLLEAIANPMHEEHESMLEWIGGPFDPEKFDPKRATKEMKKGLPDWRRM